MPKINYKKIAGFLVALFILLLPMVIFAQAGGSGPTIKNPLNSDSVSDILTNLMKIVVTIGTIVVVFFIIYSGFMFVTAGGDTGKVTKAKDMFFATIIGGAILLGADVIATVVVNTIKTTTGAK